MYLNPVLFNFVLMALRQPFAVTGNALTVKPHGSETEKDRVVVLDINYGLLLCHSFREVGIKDSIFSHNIMGMLVDATLS